MGNMFPLSKNRNNFRAERRRLPPHQNTPLFKKRHGCADAAYTEAGSAAAVTVVASL